MTIHVSRRCFGCSLQFMWVHQCTTVLALQAAAAGGIISQQTTPNQAIWMAHLGPPPSLSDMLRCMAPQQLNWDACLAAAACMLSPKHTHMN